MRRRTTVDRNTRGPGRTVAGGGVDGSSLHAEQVPVPAVNAPKAETGGLMAADLPAGFAVSSACLQLGVMDNAKEQRQSTAARLRRAARLAKASARRYPGHFLHSLRGLRSTAPGPLPLDHEPARAPLSAAWLGHATVILRIGDRWVLTDPVFSERIGVRVGPMTLGVPRLLPAFDPETLPPIDLVLVSHAHFDHLDKPSLRRVLSPRTRVVTAENTRRLIPRGFGEVRELKWDDAIDLDGVLVRAIRPRHWGARAAIDRHRGFNAYLIEEKHHGQRVLYAGDTAYTPAFDGIGRLSLTVFGIGAYDPWVHAHATPEQAWMMHQQAGGEFLLPMHHSTFRLGDEKPGEPLARLVSAAGTLRHRIIGTRLGEIWSYPCAA
jgi:L-ascorbate metabolism protein UlaG (beta-lactamase superfamily)